MFFLPFLEKIIFKIHTTFSCNIKYYFQAHLAAKCSKVKESHLSIFSARVTGVIGYCKVKTGSPSEGRNNFTMLLRDNPEIKVEKEIENRNDILRQYFYI